MAQSGHALRGPLTLGIIPTNPSPECVYLDSWALHKYGIAREPDSGVGLGSALELRSGTLLDTGAGSPGALVWSHSSEILHCCRFQWLQAAVNSND